MIRRGVVVVAVGLALWGCGVGPKAGDPCLNVSCGEGRCATAGEVPVCVCNQGYAAAGLTCAALPPTDLCASNPCVSLTNSLCQVNAGRVSCVCPTSRIELNGSCVLRTACTPNPCQKPRRTTCELMGSTFSCRCDPGFAPEGDGCSAAPVWSCASQHADGDSSEADECPPLARPLVIEVPESRTLLPAGDHDWFEISVTPAHLFSFTATSTSMPLLIEVYDGAGLTLLASDNRGAVQAEVTFVAPAGARLLMVRVRGVRANDTGAYSVSYAELGVDDYANTTAEAITLVPGPNAFAGAVQYAGDLDVVWLEMPSLTAVRLSVADAGSSGELVVEVARPDGGMRTLNSGESTTLTTPTLESFSLTVRGRNPRNLGDFAVSFGDLGPDDHSDDPSFGTPLSADDLPVPGRFERPSDVDSFRVAQLPDRIYRLRWAAQSSSPSVSVVLANGQVVASTGYGATALVWKADQSRSAAVRMQSGYSSGMPLYTVAVADLGFDDHSDDLTNATAATQGVPVAGRLELPLDVDTFSFTGTTGRIMQVSAVKTGPATSGVLRVRVYDSSGALLGEADGTVGVQLSATGLYKAQVLRGGYSSNVELITYSVTVTDQGLDDHSGTFSGATALTLGTSISGSVQYGNDVDAFAFTALAAHLYEVVCTRATGPCSFQVKDSSGVVLVTSSSSTSSPLIFLSRAAERLVVEVNSGSSYSLALGSYSLTVNDRGPEDHGSTIGTATPLTVGTPIAGNIAFTQDVDVFSFSTIQGHVYAAAISLGSSRLELRDANNSVLSSSYNGVASFIAPTNGPFFVAVMGSYTTGTYSLTVTDRGVDDHVNTTVGATPLTLGSPLSGDVQYQGDLDVFSVAVVAGRHHQVTCTAVSGSCSYSVLDASGSVLANGYSGSTLAFKPPANSTTVYLRVSSSSESARYTVLVADLGPDDHGDTLADATVLTLDVAATSGVLAVGGDVDAFSVVASTGQIILLSCTTTSGTACALTVSSPSGSTLLQNSAAPSARTGFLAVNAGTYLVQVRGSSSAPGAYTLAATRGTDDFTTVRPLTLGTPTTGGIDYVGDSDVFSIALTQGVSARVTLSSGVRASVTSPSGTYVPTVYGGSTNTIVPSITGTYLFTVASDFYQGTLTSYTITVQ